MTIVKRAFLSMMRSPVKNTLILLLVVVLSVFLSLGMSTRTAIHHMEMHLRERLPAIATLTHDARATQAKTPSLEMIAAVGALPYVRAYDFRSWTFLFSETLEWAIPSIDDAFIPEGMTKEEMILSYNLGGVTSLGGSVNRFQVGGVNHPYLTDIQAGLIALDSGRLMTEIEIETGAHVALVSRDFAEVNQLEVGAIISLENNLFDHEAIAEYGSWTNGTLFSSNYWHMDAFKIANQLIDLEVVGIFDIQRDFIYLYYAQEMMDIVFFGVELYNRIYIPHRLQMELVHYLTQYEPDLYAAYGMTEDHPLMLEPMFLLSDPRDAQQFVQAAQAVLPENWFIEDTSAAFAPFISSMDHMLWLANLIVIGAVGTAVSILTLLFTLLIHGRRHEISIYRALGETKQKMLGQLLVEVAAVATVAMMIGLFIGNHLAHTISRDMLTHELIRQEQENPSPFANQLPVELILFTPESMSIEELIDTYDVSLNWASTTLFFSVQFGSILFSTTISVIYLIRLNPKKILF